MANVEVVIGTYEEYILGYRTDTKNDKLSLIQSFSDKSHAGSIRCIASQGKYVATGGIDDRIFVYDLKSRKQSQILQHHEGNINSLAFSPDGTHLLTVGEDGRFVVVRLSTWMIEANWNKAHDGQSVTHISCHPSGKLALTLGSDLTLRTWNLVKGRIAFKTNLKNRASLRNSPDCISWSLEGNHFTVAGPRVVEIWSIETAKVVKTEQFDSKPISVCWVSDSDVLVGLENGKISLISIDGKEPCTSFEAHTTRVKSMAFACDVLASCSSSGEVALWSVDLEAKSLQKTTSVNIGCRPTCISILDATQFDACEDPTATEEPEEVIVVKKPIKKAVGVVTIESNEQYEKELSASKSQSQPKAVKRKNEGKHQSKKQKNKKKN